MLGFVIKFSMQCQIFFTIPPCACLIIVFILPLGFCSLCSTCRVPGPRPIVESVWPHFEDLGQPWWQVIPHTYSNMAGRQLLQAVLLDSYTLVSLKTSLALCSPFHAPVRRPGLSWDCLGQGWRTYGMQEEFGWYAPVSLNPDLKRCYESCELHRIKSFE